MNLASGDGLEVLISRLEGRGLPLLDMYKARCLQRRVAVRMRACGVGSMAEYIRVVETDPEEAGRLLATLTVNVTGFFRNPETWMRLRTLASDLPGVLEGKVRAWSAGCATGEEAWTIAMVLASSIEQRGMTVDGSSLAVDATDLDRACLHRAEAGRYLVADVQANPSVLLGRWTRSDGVELEVGDALRGCVTFQLHDLGRDPPPNDRYDLLVCRNVLIYFSREVQVQLLTSFARVLRTGGILVLGKVETLPVELRPQFEVLDGRERVFRRLA